MRKLLSLNFFGDPFSFDRCTVIRGVVYYEQRANQIVYRFVYFYLSGSIDNAVSDLDRSSVVLLVTRLAKLYALSLPCLLTACHGADDA